MENLVIEITLVSVKDSKPEGREMFENLRQNFIILLQEKIDYTKEYKKPITPTYVYKTKEKSN